MNNLAAVLKIEVALLNDSESRGLELAETVWKSAGSPTEAGRLVDVLEEILQRSRAEQIRYPPVLLLRKKELAQKPAKFNICPPEKSKHANESVRTNACSRCGGRGILINPTGRTGTLCPNGCFLKGQRKF